MTLHKVTNGRYATFPSRSLYPVVSAFRNVLPTSQRAIQENCLLTTHQPCQHGVTSVMLIKKENNNALAACRHHISHRRHYCRDEVVDVMHDSLARWEKALASVPADVEAPTSVLFFLNWCRGCGPPLFPRVFTSVALFT